MRHLITLSLFSLLLPLLACATPVAKHVIVVSIDGGKPQTISRATDLPEIHRFANEGATSWEAQTILPSATLQSHASMISGVDVPVHGIDWNKYIPEKGTITVPTMFSEARGEGKKTALFAAKDKFKHYNRPGSITKFSLVYGGTKKMVDAAAKYFRDEKPNLLMVHIADVDATGHKHGWDTAEFMAALRTVDANLATLRKAIADSGVQKNTLLIITADHGGTGKGHGGAQPEHRNIPWIAWGAGVKSGALPAGISTMDTPATALWALGLDVPNNWQGAPVRQAFKE